jgi:hypothetical protein
MTQYTLLSECDNPCRQIIFLSLSLSGIVVHPDYIFAEPCFTYTSILNLVRGDLFGGKQMRTSSGPAEK